MSYAPSRPQLRRFPVRVPSGARVVSELGSALPSLLAAVFFAAYTALSVTKHLQLRSTGYDLGIFEQAVRAYSEGRAPVSELKAAGYNLLGDHFHPILAALAPFYRVFPSPLTLVIAQAALMALSVVPVTRVAIRATGPALGTVVGAAYGLSWGLQRAVAFDFHEIAFAVPLLAFSLEGLVRRRWRSAAVWALPLVLVKEDLPLTVAVIGLYILLHGRRRLGGAVLAYGLLIVLVVIPALNPHGQYDYFHTAGSGASDPFTRFFLPPQKFGTLLALVAPTALLALRSPLIALALPTVVWRFWATNPAYWGTQHHYSAVLMPIIFVAFADALGRLDERGRQGLTRGAVAVSAAVSLCALALLPLSDLAGPSWKPSPWAEAAREVVAAVPDGAEVTAVNNLVPQLTSRTRVYQFPQVLDRGDRPEWLLVSDPARGGMPVFAWELPRLREITGLGYHLVMERSGIQLYRLSGR